METEWGDDECAKAQWKRKALLAGVAAIIGGGFFDGIGKPGCGFSGGLTSQHPRKGAFLGACVRSGFIHSGLLGLLVSWNKDRRLLLGFSLGYTSKWASWNGYRGWLARRAFR